MDSVLFAPHNDDETLFASFLILRHRPHVVICLYGGEAREQESERALAELECNVFSQWYFPAENPDWSDVRVAIKLYSALYDHAFAPFPNFDANGHDPDKTPPTGWGVLQHDMIGKAVLDAFGAERTTLYLTYTRWEGKCRSGNESPFEHRWISRKLAALSCYESQHALASVQPWFVDNDLREYLA